MWKPLEVPMGLRRFGGHIGKLGRVPNVQNGTLDSQRRARDFLAIICLVVDFERKSRKKKKKTWKVIQHRNSPSRKGSGWA